MITLFVIATGQVAAQAQSQENYGGTSQASQAKIISMIYAKFGSGYTGRTMVCIARRESGLNPRAANYGDSNGGSFGLFQINGIHKWAFGKGSHSIYNPSWNIQVAYRLSNGGRSLGPWGYSC